MKYIKFIFLLLSYNLGLNAFAQTLDIQEIMDKYQAKNSKPEIKITNGSPYFVDEWTPGSVIFKNGTTYKVKSLNYNIYSNEFIFTQAGNEFAISNLEEIQEFKINESIFIYYFIGDRLKKSFLQVLSENNSLVLFKKFDCIIVEGKKSDGIIPGTIDKYKITSEYYFILHDLPAQRLKIKKSNILELMSDHSQEIQNFINDNKINLKKEEDLIKIFNYYNKLN